MMETRHPPGPIRHSTRLALGDRTVDLWTGRLSTGGALRQLELRLLQVLVEHRGTPVPAPLLLKEAFDYAPNSRSKTLYTTIHRLRSAIEPDPAHPRFVLAQRGGGYLLAAEAEVIGVDTAPSNLALELDRFVGRAELLARLAMLDVPLVTLVGPGGGGKSRLAVHLLATNPPADGAWRVPLADSARTPVAALAAVLGSGDDPTRVVGRLAELGRPVVILDDAEVALDRVRELVDTIRRGAPTARVIVTSREPLAVAGEHRLEVGPMDPGEAIELLRARAAEVQPGCDPSPEVWAEIVDLADRLPLAIELAAGRLWAFSPTEVRDQLRHGVDLPTDRADRPERHRSLGAVLDGTWDRLEPWEQEALGRLSVLDGAFGAGVAEAVLGEASGPDRVDPLIVLSRLRLRGLLAPGPVVDGKPFRNLRTVVALVRARVGPAVRDDALGRLTRYTLDRAATVYGPSMARGGRTVRFDGGYDRLAVASVLGAAPPDDAGARDCALVSTLLALDRMEEAERLTAEAVGRAQDPSCRGTLLLFRLTSFWARSHARVAAEAGAVTGDPTLPAWVRFQAGELLVRAAVVDADPSAARATLARVASLVAEGVPHEVAPLRPRLHELEARVLASVDDFAGAAAAFVVAERSHADAGDLCQAAVMRAEIGQQLVRMHRVTEAMVALTDAARRVEQTVTPPLAAHTFVVGALGEHSAVGRPEEAGRHLRRAIGLARAAGTRGMMLEFVTAHAEHDVWSGRLDDAEQGLTDARALASHAVGDAHRLPLGRIGALVALARGRSAEAEVLATRAIDEAVRLDVPHERARSQAVWVAAAVALGRLAAARRCLEETLPGQRWPSPGVVLDLAELRRATGDPSGAAFAVGVALAASTDANDRCRALLTAAGLTGDRSVFEAARVLKAQAPDPDRTLGGWIAVADGRICRAQGQPMPERPAEVPRYASVLALAVDETFGAP